MSSLTVRTASVNVACTMQEPVDDALRVVASRTGMEMEGTCE
jgi:hypothetical protein